MKTLLVDGTVSYGGAFEIAFNLAKYANQIEPGSVCLASSQPPGYLQSRINGSFASYNFRTNRWKFARESPFPAMDYSPESAPPRASGGLSAFAHDQELRSKGRPSE